MAGEHPLDDPAGPRGLPAGDCPSLPRCPGCGLVVAQPLAPGTTCAACATAVPWSAAWGETGPAVGRISISRREIEAAVRRCQGDSPRRLEPVRVLRWCAALVALGLASLSGYEGVRWLGDLPANALAATLAELARATRVALLAGGAGLLLALVALLSLVRSRHRRQLGLLATTLSAVAGACAALGLGAVLWLNDLGFDLDGLQMPPFPEPGSFDPVSERIMAATVTLFVPGLDGHTLRAVMGTGAVVRQDQGRVLVLTCSHVALPGRPAATWRAAPLAHELLVIFSDGGTSWGRVAWIAPPPVDLVLIEADRRGPVAAVELAEDAAGIGVGAEALFVPNPLRHGWRIHRGQVVARQGHDTPTGRYDLLVSDLPVQPGDSGSGLFDGQGRLVGVNTWADRDAGGGVRALSLSSDALSRFVSVGWEQPTDRLLEMLPATRGVP